MIHWVDGRNGERNETAPSDRPGLMKLAEHGKPAGHELQLTIAETRSSYRALRREFSRGNSRIVVRRSLERGLDPRAGEPLHGI